MEQDVPPYSPPWADRVRPIRWSAWILALISLTGLAFRLWLGPLPWLYTGLILTLAVGFIAVPATLRAGGSPRRAGSILVAGAATIVAAVALGQGGLDAPLLVLLPFLPVATSFLLGSRASLLMAAVICVLLATLVLLHAQTSLIPPWALDEQLARSARAVWLGASTLLIAFVMWLYDRRSGRLSRRLMTHATRDHLTGLANRRHFQEQLELECRRAIRDKRPLGLAMIDIDHFKAFNDTYGHPHGDQCLIAVSYANSTCVRRAGDLLARYGGEEFVALFPGANESQARGIAESMRGALREMEIPHEGSPTGVVTMSVGVAAGVDAAELVPDELLQRADDALYRAKQAGRDRIEGSRPQSD